MSILCILNKEGWKEMGLFDVEQGRVEGDIMVEGLHLLEDQWVGSLNFDNSIGKGQEIL